VRWDCLGRYGGLAMFWHDQTKVGNYDACIRIPVRATDLADAGHDKSEYSDEDTAGDDEEACA
jgi:hypothetical protein